MLSQKTRRNKTFPSISLFRLFNNIIISIKSAVALNTASVVLWAGNFCFLDFQQIGAHPMYIIYPVVDLALSSTSLGPKLASEYVAMSSLLLNFKKKFLVLFKYLRTFCTFLQSLMIGLFLLEENFLIVSQISGLVHLAKWIKDPTTILYLVGSIFYLFSSLSVISE